ALNWAATTLGSVVVAMTSTPTPARALAVKGRRPAFSNSAALMGPTFGLYLCLANSLASAYASSTLGMDSYMYSAAVFLISAMVGRNGLVAMSFSTAFCAA